MPRLSAWASISLVALYALTPLHADAATINVPSAPAPTITIAINIAQNGDEIVVAPGTYFDAINLNGKTLTLRSSAGAERTIIDGLGQFKPVVRIISGEGAATTIDGFTLRNGNATSAAPGDRGGGIYCNLTSPTIKNCVLTDNQASVGGGFYANQGAPTLINCSFIDNAAATGAAIGGAAYLNSTTITATDCTFVGNLSAGNAGGVRHSATSGTYLRCVFESNVAGTQGGAMDMTGSPSSLAFLSCTYVGNSATGVGGAVQNASPNTQTMTWVNCIFDANLSNGNGGAIHTAGKASVTNCTVANNSAGGNGGALFVAAGGSADVQNSIVWDNSPNGFTGTTTTTYTCHQGAIAGAGNIVLNPLFVNAAAGDLRLASGSPCIDAANTALLTTTANVDIAGEPRVVNAAALPTGVAAYGYVVDMGAHEFPAVTPPSSCPGDIDGDGDIDAADLAALLGGWGLCF